MLLLTGALRYDLRESPQSGNEGIYVTPALSTSLHRDGTEGGSEREGRRKGSRETETQTETDGWKEQERDKGREGERDTH